MILGVHEIIIQSLGLPQHRKGQVWVRVRISLFYLQGINPKYYKFGHKKRECGVVVKMD